MRARKKKERNFLQIRDAEDRNTLSVNIRKKGKSKIRTERKRRFSLSLSPYCSDSLAGEWKLFPSPPPPAPPPFIRAFFDARKFRRDKFRGNKKVALTRI